MEKYPDLDFEFLMADNGSTDHTKDVLKAIANKDKRFKVIINTRNFGPERSGYNVFCAAKGDCVISMNSDLENPPELIEDFVNYWLSGSKIVIAVNSKSKKNPIMNLVRKLYYRIINLLSDDVEQIENFTAFGLYDKSVMPYLTSDRWPPPYFRGLVSELGIDYKVVSYVKPKRKHGKTSYNFFSYFDLAMTGLTSYSKAPLRLATLIGFFASALGFLIALGYLIMKLLFWTTMQTGIAPLLIGLFFFSSVQIMFVGIIGEYLYQVLERVRVKPLVMEAERINFEEK
jgi:glycosyltransferase involved in cell wall biosynthesis